MQFTDEDGARMRPRRVKSIKASKPKRPKKTVDLDDIFSALISNDCRRHLCSAADNFGPSNARKLKKSQIKYLIRTATKALLSEDTLLEISPPVIICGDTVSLKPFLTPSQFCDYVDRGEQSIELICLLYYLKTKYPENFYVLRGNHETAEINSTHGFKEDCMLHYDLKVWNLFQESFKAMPLAAVVGSKIFCLHGGISPHLTSLDDIRRIPRPVEAPDSGLVCDLIWSDPVPEDQHDKHCGYTMNLNRSTSVWYCHHVVEEFLNANGLELIVRGHEMFDFGFGFTADQKVLTIFTAPHYCGYNNDAAILCIDEEFQCQIQSFQFKRPPNLCQQITLMNSDDDVGISTVPPASDDLTCREMKGQQTAVLNEIIN